MIGQRKLEDYKFTLDMLDAYFRKKRIDAAIRGIDSKVVELCEKKKILSGQGKVLIKRYAIPFAIVAGNMLAIGFGVITWYFQHQNQQVIPPSPKLYQPVLPI